MSTITRPSAYRVIFFNITELWVKVLFGLEMLLMTGAIVGAIHGYSLDSHSEEEQYRYTQKLRK
jgi:hypothetical protein